MSWADRRYGLRRTAHRLRTYARSPKGRLLLYSGVLALLGAIQGDGGRILIAMIVSVSAGVTVDAALSVLIRRKWKAPSGAVLTGLSVTMVISPFGPWFAPAAAVVAGVAAKHFVRTRTANVFNPSALGLVLAASVLDRGLSWWGSLPEYGLAGAALIILIGALTADHVNKLPLVLAFLGTYFSIFAAATFAPGGSVAAEVFLAPDAHAALFFAFFMLDDPPTSPVRYIDQIWYGALIAVLAAIVFVCAGVAYYLLAALLIGNVVEAGRRVLQARRRRVRRRVAGSPASGLAR